MILAEIGPMAKPRFLGLDGLRGVCALSVVLYHSQLLFRPGVIFCHGYLAVDMFFLLSGFVIAANYDGRFAQGLTTGRFLLARLGRLAPVYWAGLCLCLACGLLTTLWLSSPSPGQVTLWTVMAMFLVPRLGPQTFAYPINSIAWTLAWEIIVNIIYAQWLRRLTTRVLLAVIGLFFLAAIAESLVNPRGWSFGMTGMDVGLGGLRTVPEFLLGVVLFRAFAAGKLARLPVVTPLLPVVAWLAIAAIPDGPPWLDALLVIVACPLLVALLVRSPLRAPAWFAPLGALSYPLYACHLAILSLAKNTPIFGLDRHPDVLRATGVVLLACAAAWVIQRLAEPKSGFAGVPTQPLAPACLDAKAAV
jgi:peptidoglycan/LPS O-acetylase OafA/YrhL